MSGFPFNIDSKITGGFMTQRTPQQVLDAALSYLEEHGWTRGAMGPDERCCAVVAIARVTSGIDDFSAATRLLRERVGGRHLAEWNDYDAKDFNEVRAVMKGTGNE